MKAVADSPIADSLPARIELPIESSKQAGTNVSLADLEQELTGLEAAFAELERLKGAVQHAEQSFEQALQEEKQLVTNGELPEKDAIRRLVEVRAKKDLRNQRLLDGNKKLALQRDLVVFDVAEPLHHRFVSYANDLLIAKEREISKLFAELLPPGNGLRLSIDELTRASAPVTRYRQVANFIRNELPTDQAERLRQLAELPARWIKAIVELP